jgi:hypothetical protein
MAKGLVSYFAEVGRRVRANWQRFDCDEVELPKIAVEALADVQPGILGGVEDFLESTSVLTAEGAVSRTFSDCGVPLYSDSLVVIEALIWLQATTSIHQHGFAGAFKVVAGSSLHTTYAFSLRDTINARLLLGRLAHAKSELLRVGDTRAIGLGNHFIHRIFHLGRPSITLVVRSLPLGLGPQFDYHPPGLALDPYYREPVWERAVRLLGIIQRMNPEEFDDRVARYVQEAGAMDATYALLSLFPRGGTLGPRLGELLERKHEGLGNCLAEVLIERRRAVPLVRLRERALDEDLRTFVGLMLNVPDRGAILAFVEEALGQPDGAIRLEQWQRMLAAEGISVVFRDECPWITPLSKASERSEVSGAESGAIGG